jgi:dihydroorotase
MTILVRKALVKDIHSSLHNQRMDILLSDGLITEIAEQIETVADLVIDMPSISVSPGWVDLFVKGTDPGFEFKDDLDSVSASAAKGGFTHLFLTPNTQPVTQNKTGVQYIKNHHSTRPVVLHPIGAVTKNTDGKELTEMFEMKQNGAIAFGDGTKSIQSAGLLIKALQYVNAFDGIIIQLPDDHSVAPHGLMHEGIVSTQVGLPGKPALSEEIMVARDIELLRYTNSRLHLTGISLATSVEMIRKAKKEGLNLTCSTTPYHLVFTDASLLNGYDTNLKVNPPLRTEKDRQALLAAVKDGTIDCITTHHTAQNKDAKICEFEYAGLGMLGLESAFGILQMAGLDADEILRLICFNPRKIFGLESSISVGNKADFTIFNEQTERVFNSTDIQSKSSNSPFIGTLLKGEVIATVLNNRINSNQTNEQ